MSSAAGCLAADSQHRGAGKLSLAQIRQGPIGVLNRIDGGVRAQRRGGGDAHQFLAIRAGQFGHREQAAFLLKQAIGESRDVAHMDATADYRTALGHDLQRERHRRADRREDQRGIKHRRGRLRAVARPARAAVQGELLGRPVAGAGLNPNLNSNRGHEGVRMDFKTVLVDLDANAGCAARVEVATDLARRSAGIVIGMAAVGDGPGPAPIRQR